MESPDAGGGVDRPPAAIRSREGQRSPFEWYAEMRERAPVHYDEGRERWDVFGHEDVDRVLGDHEAFSATRTPDAGQPAGEEVGSGQRRDAAGASPMLQTMITTDPPEHDRLRGFVDGRFQPGAIREYRPRVEAAAERVLADLAGEDEFDFVEGFAVPFPVVVIAELLGIPADRRAAFRAWSNALVAQPGDDSAEAARRVLEERAAAQREMGEYFARLLAERRGGDGDDLVTLAANADELTQGEAIGFCMLLLLAGNVTTTNLLTNAIWTFEEQGVTEAVRTGAVDRAQAIEEVLRFRSPVQSLDRVAREDVDLGGRQIQAGERLTCWLGSANRDPAVFDAPEEFRPERRPNRHVAFGTGVHFCLGAHLARLEADVGLSHLFERYDRLTADRTDLDPVEGFLYGLESLPVEVDASTASPN